MDEGESAIFAAEIGSAPMVDLHGLRVDEAIHALDAFLHREFSHPRRKGVKVVGIIHGRGSGVLKTAVHRHLSAQPFVTRIRDSQSASHAGAVTWAILAPNA